MPVEPTAQAHEPHPSPNTLTSYPNQPINYTPNPSTSISVTPHRQKILDSICALYSGSASETDMRVYAEKAVYDDPLSFCDNRYKIAGQWYGIPIIMSKSETLATEVVESSNDRLVFKLRQEYTPRLMPSQAINSELVFRPRFSLVSLGLADLGGGEKVVYHKDLWNEKDYSHQGMGFFFKKLNGDWLTIITQPPKSL